MGKQSSQLQTLRQKFSKEKQDSKFIGDNIHTYIKSNTIQLFVVHRFCLFIIEFIATIWMFMKMISISDSRLSSSPRQGAKGGGGPSL